ncbi:unnamed protein product [Anisakis simplex]|uniref:Leucine-rich repeat-containing protein 15 n=1 Tax=Anisakis simplex TaxID=6269 RepID=A0A0M3JUA4_ANISI|nr:unnamed protein product [Anisakis simplex]
MLRLSNNVFKLALRTYLLSSVILLLTKESCANRITYERCPTVCHCLDTHVDCSRRSLASIPVMLPSWTTVLFVTSLKRYFRELQGNEITELLPTAFIGLDHLISIDLSDNHIQSFSRLVFAYTPHLQTLILRKNRLSSVPLGIESLNSLHRLDLKGNDISNLTSIDISRLARIDIVDLARNSIRELPQEVFINHAESKITRLDLSNNALSILRPRSFSSLYTLRILRLSRNKIHTVEKNAFDGLISLRSLDISRNRLTRIRALTFNSLISLQNLTISRNLISTLEDGAFWGVEQLQRLIIADNRLTAITGGWLYGMLSLIYLDLSSNSVSWIEPSVWSLCSTIEWLSLASNRLRSLQSLLFKKLSRLQYLSLAYNHIDVLHKSAMSGLDTLASLDLSGNGLAVCVEDGSVLSNSSLPALHTLKFASNRVRIIPLRAFHNFPSLQYLDLSDNPIASIQEGAFEPLHLKQLLMNTSSLVCDCELKWFSNWLFTSGLSRTTISTICLHPSPLQGIDVALIDTSNLTCVDNSPRPRLVNQPSVETKALLGSEVRLECTGYGASPLEMSWKVMRNGRSHILTNDATTEFIFNRSLTTNGSLSLSGIGTADEGRGDFAVEYLHSEVRLSEIAFSDEAEYQCIVRNHYGSAYSLRARIVVMQKPYIVASPSNVSILRGGNVKLRCSARGVPLPVIKWQKDGGNEFPAAVERRLHVKANDDNLYMVNVTLKDAGLYTCLVSNEAGQAQGSAYLNVFDVDFDTRFDEQNVQTSSTVLFNCSTTHMKPPLSIVWYHNEQQIEPRTAPSRFVFMLNQQVLVITEVRASDSGLYSCELMVGNDMLSRQTSKLIVDQSAEDNSKKRLDEFDSRQPKQQEHFLLLVILFAFIVFVSLVTVVALACTLLICCTSRSRNPKRSSSYRTVKVS